MHSITLPCSSEDGTYLHDLGYLSSSGLDEGMLGVGSDKGGCVHAGNASSEGLVSSLLKVSNSFPLFSVNFWWPAISIVQPGYYTR